VNQFALRQDGVLYTLTNNGEVQSGGNTLCSGVSELQTDNFGQLVLCFTNGSEHVLAGRYTSSSNMVAASSAAAQQLASASGELEIGGFATSLNHDLVFDSIGLETGYVRGVKKEYRSLRGDISSLAEPHWNAATVGDLWASQIGPMSTSDALHVGDETVRLTDKDKASSSASDIQGQILDHVIGAMKYGIGRACDQIG
jgi:hypothetical protein